MERGEVASILFDTHDTDGYHTVLASALQAWTMQATRDVTGWRLSSVLPAACAIPAVYTSPTGWAGARSPGSPPRCWRAHVMLTFALILQQHLCAARPLPGAGCDSVGVGEASVLRFMLIGVILGFGFLLHSLTLLAMLPIGVLLAALILPDWRRMAWVASRSPSV